MPIPTEEVAVFQQIIVPLDGSEDAAEALGPASALAQRVGAPLHVVALHLPGRDPRELEATVLAQCDCTGDVVRMVDVRPLEVDVPTDLTRLANRWGPALIVMASHGRARSAAVLGSVATEILAAADQPVLVVGPNVIRSRFRTHGPAIVAVSGDDDAEVLSMTAALLADTDFEPVVANVIAPDATREAGRLRTAAQGFDMPIETAVAHRAASYLQAATDVATVDFDVHHDDKPADAIVREAIQRRAAVIIMTTSARLGFDRLTTGSIAADVVRDAPCPVLVTRQAVGESSM